MTKLSRKLFLSILTVVLTFIALGTTTFAWFTLGGTVTATGFQANVTAGEGIEISTDGKTWTNTVNLAADMTLIDVTSPNGVTMYKMGTAAVGNAAATANTDYFEKTLYIRATSDCTVNLTSITHSAFLTGTNWTADASIDLTGDGDYEDTGEFAAGASLLFDPLNALRFSFTETTIAATPVTTTNSILAIEGSSNKGSTDTFTWSAGSTLESFVAGTVYYTRAGEGTPASPYVYTRVTAASPIASTTYYTLTTTGIATAYAKAKGYTIHNFSAPATPTATIADTTPSTGTSDSAKVCDGFTYASDDLVSDLTGDEDDTAALDADYDYTIVTLRVWLEGWDADCINAILGLQNVTLAFTFDATSFS